MISLKELVTEMKEYQKKVKLFEDVGGLVKVLEVEPTSLVQLVVFNKEGSWQYFQQWLDKMPDQHKKLLEGAYHGDVIGNFKIIGIYNGTPGLEMLGKR